MSIDTPRKRNGSQMDAFTKNRNAPLMTRWKRTYRLPLWVKAVQKAGSTDTEKVIAALPGWSAET